MTQALPISRLINVQVNLAPKAAQMQSLSTLLILGSSPVINTVEGYREYVGIDGVAADFGTSAPEYLAAVLWFEQVPKPNVLMIGRWAETATKGQLIGGVLPTASQDMTTWRAITTGSFAISIDGADEVDILAMDFSAVSNMNGVASVIQTALAAEVAGCTVVWDSASNHFVVTSNTSGTSSSVSFATQAATGADISVLAGLTANSGGYLVTGIAAQTAVECVADYDNRFGQKWYAVTVLGADTDDSLEIGAYIEAATNKHIYGVSTTDPAILTTTSTTDVASLLKALGYKRTVTQFSSSNAYAVCSLLGRILTVNYQGSMTVITLMYKQAPGIVPETLSVTQANALEAKNCNVFVAYNNDTAIIENGVVANGDFLDIITGTDWLALSIQNNIFNLLYTTNTKIPQTDAGNNMIATSIESVCSQGVRNGLLAPGVWQSDGFGALSRGDFLPKGFYVYAPPIAEQPQADREARKSVLFQVAAKLAGAIHTVDVLVNVNR